MSREAHVWLKIVCACLVLGKHVTYVTRESVFLVYALMTVMPINVGVIIKNVLRRVREKKGQSFGFGGLLTRFLHGHDIEEEEADYRPIYDSRGINVTKTMEPEGINGPVLSVNEHNARIDNMLSHLVRSGFEEPIDDDVATEDEITRVDSDIQSSDVEEKDSEMGEATLAPIDNEE
ncbi:hypothetical protein HAX54_039067 [Datura stramonium]|uniref:Putative plant transposon protein domain-containing protein n=1 Tax=Datura stramonium TaxID=4076 RepID=A0ABS8VLZ4_DATST|nr:hypothetical protein [Datura stramonium]